MNNPLEQICSVDEAAKLWDLNPSYVKNLCNLGKIQAKKIGNSWVVLKDQPNPKIYGKRDETEKK